MGGSSLIVIVDIVSYSIRRLDHGQLYSLASEFLTVTLCFFLALMAGMVLSRPLTRKLRCVLAATSCLLGLLGVGALCFGIIRSASGFRILVLVENEWCCCIAALVMAMALVLGHDGAVGVLLPFRLVAGEHSDAAE